MRSIIFPGMPVKSRDWRNVELVDNVDNLVEKYYGNV